MKNNEKARCFVLLAKFTGGKYNGEETSAKCLQISSYRQEQVDKTHRTNSVQHKDQVTSNMLFRILQIQEAGRTEEYHVNGFRVRVQVSEDKDF